MDRIERLREKASRLPAEPGVYLWKDAKGKVLYVGKAARLRDRVRNYLADPETLDPKTASLARRIADVDFLATGSETEALLLEDQLVKEYKPRYNVRLRDDKRFPWLRLTTSEPFPRIDVVRKPGDDGDLYFGPYVNPRAMRRTLKTITSIFPVRTCTLKLPGETVPRPCLDYYIHRCCAPCVDKVGQGEYRELVGQVARFLEGRSDELESELRARMQAHSEALRFEEAGKLRDQLEAVRQVVERQEVVLGKGEDADALGLEREGKHACGVVLRVRDGRLLHSEHHFLRGELDEDAGEFFRRFAAEYLANARQPGRTILLDHPLEEADRWEEILRGRHGRAIKLHVPQRGKWARLVAKAHANARFKLRERMARDEDRGRAKRVVDVPEVLDLKERLGLAVAPHSMECFDMSHFQGSQRVGALVYFSDGTPVKSRYRRFRIQQVEGNDDYAMMQECVERYYSRLASEEQLPADLVVIDGGKGQLGVAARTLARYGFVETAVIGLAKREEEVFVPGRSEPILLPRSSPALKLLQRIRDEAHRFAVSYHRQRRDRSTLSTVLDEIPGIGKAKRHKLLAHFGSPAAVEAASPGEIMAVPGLGEGDARRIREFFLARRGGGA